MISFEHENKSEGRQPHNYYPLLWIRKLVLGLSSLRLQTTTVWAIIRLLYLPEIYMEKRFIYIS